MVRPVHADSIARRLDWLNDEIAQLDEQYQAAVRRSEPLTQRLRRRGKSGKVALVAVMRKLLLQLHAVARRGTPWTRNMPSPPESP